MERRILSSMARGSPFHPRRAANARLRAVAGGARRSDSGAGRVARESYRCGRGLQQAAARQLGVAAPASRYPISRDATIHRFATAGRFATGRDVVRSAGLRGVSSGTNHAGGSAGDFPRQAAGRRSAGEQGADTRCRLALGQRLHRRLRSAAPSTCVPPVVRRGAGGTSGGWRSGASRAQPSPGTELSAMSRARYGRWYCAGRAGGDCAGCRARAAAAGARPAVADRRR